MILFNGGPDRGDDNLRPLHFMEVETPLIFTHFPLFDLPQNGVDGIPLQGPIPISSLTQFLNL